MMKNILKKLLIFAFAYVGLYSQVYADFVRGDGDSLYYTYLDYLSTCEKLLISADKIDKLPNINEEDKMVVRMVYTAGWVQMSYTMVFGELNEPVLVERRVLSRDSVVELSRHGVKIAADKHIRLQNAQTLSTLAEEPKDLAPPNPASEDAPWVFLMIKMKGQAEPKYYIRSLEEDKYLLEGYFKGLLSIKDLL